LTDVSKRLLERNGQLPSAAPIMLQQMVGVTLGRTGPDSRQAAERLDQSIECRTFWIDPVSSSHCTRLRRAS
jgi:hypothetical protein